MKNSHRQPFLPRAVLAWLVVGVASQWGSAQTTLTPWGNVAGMRVNGQPVEFEAGPRVVRSDWLGFSAAVKYLQRPRYSRAGARCIVESEIDGMAFSEVLEDTAPGEATLELQITAKTNLAMAGAYFCVDMPDAEFADGTLEMIQANGSDQKRLRLASEPLGQQKEYLRQTANGARIVTPSRKLELRWSVPMKVLVRRDLPSHPTSLNDPSVRQVFVTNNPSAGPRGYQLYLELMSGDAAVGRTATAYLKMTADAAEDSRTVNLALDTTKPGRRFDGIGGNFRMQFAKTDVAVFQYNLENLRVAWGRVDLPWADWDPDEQADPLSAARAGRLSPRVSVAMETARALSRRHMPVIVSAWVPPKWARAPEPQPAGLRGTALNGNKMERVCSSLASYLIFLKEHYGVEAIYFSFNEPETGVDVRQTAAEHLQYLKLLGAELARRGLATKLLLGDTAHGTAAALEFIRPALADSAAYRYIGAIAFHTWRGCTAEALAGWSNAARELGVPLLVTEAGPDAHMHEYPSVRLEPWFQLQEIELYLRVCAYGQPATIMEWQLTTDYSLLSGEGVYGESGPLKPTQRFWNLKQLGATPAGAFALPIKSDLPDVTCAAFGDLANGSYAVHIVNRGAARPAALVGLPRSMTVLRRYITDATRGMEEDGRIDVRSGKAEFILPTASYTTLLGLSSISPSPAAGETNN